MHSRFRLQKRLASKGLGCAPPLSWLERGFFIETCPSIGRHITGGCNIDKHIIVAAIYHADTGSLESREFHHHQEDARLAAQWFHSPHVEFVIIESKANYHLLFYDTLRGKEVNIAVINPRVY